jgi:ABC-type branched-subunit amino acid transport system ATPase component/ABC-type branched-subunit amino acid transport system permease subunit
MDIESSVRDDVSGIGVDRSLASATSAAVANEQSVVPIGEPEGCPARTPSRLAGYVRSLAVVALVLVPLLFGEVIIYKAGLVLVFFVGAIGLHVLVNWAGELSLAHAAMVGVPAFTSLALSHAHDISPIYLLPVAVVVGVLVGTIVGLPVLRARGVAVALVTLIAGVGLSRFFFSQEWLVGGSSGRAAALPTLGPVEFSTSRSLYPLLLLIVFGAVVAAWALMHSKVGRGWRWVQANPAAASAFGVPVAFYRLSAYAVGGAFAGLGGGLTVMWVQRLGRTAFPDNLAITYLLVAVLAGPGFIGGLALAAWLLHGGPLFTSEFFGTNVGDTLDTILAYGAPLALIDMMARRQAGLNGVGQLIMHRFGGRKEATSAAYAPTAVASIPSGLSEARSDLRSNRGQDPHTSRSVGPTERSECDRPPATAPSGTPVLEVEGVSVAFGGLKVLSDVSMRVFEGQVVGLIGPNGAGKTTLFNVISGLQRSSEGVVRFDGSDIGSMSTDRRASLGIGRSFQHLGVIGDETVTVNLMAAEHLAAGYRASDLLLRPWRWWTRERHIRERARYAAQEFGLADLSEERIKNLSFGKARFAELACLLVEQPRLMLLDEPTTGLDMGESRILLELLRQQRSMNTTILLVAHDVRFIMDLCDHVYVLSEGRLLVDGPPETVQHHPDVIEAYLGHPA